MFGLVSLYEAWVPLGQGLVKGEKFCFRNLYFYFQHGESHGEALGPSGENFTPLLENDKNWNI